jgi:hypothetical protein
MSAATTIPTDWSSQCMALIRNASNFTEGLVDGLGQHVAKFDETAWGVSISTCYKYCGSIRFPVSHYLFCRLRWTRVMPCLPLQRIKINEDLHHGKYSNLSVPLFQVIPLICNANRFLVSPDLPVLSPTSSCLGLP